MQYTRLIAAASVSALLAACSGGGHVVPANAVDGQAQQAQSSERSAEFTSVSTFVAQNTATGEFVRVFPTRPAFDTFRASAAGQRFTQATGNLTYHGGPVQTNPKMYVVFWGPAWNTSSGDPSGVKARTTAFLSIVGGSGWNNSTTQYTQSDGQHVGNQSGSLAAWYVDTASAPPSRPTQSQIAAEATKAAAKYGDYSASAAYIVVLPHGIRPSGFGTQYCAWHSSTTVSGKGTIAYTNDPYLPDVGASCGAGSVNSPGTLDGISIVYGHEQGETETDPQPNTGWVDLTNNSENGDKCAWTGLINNPAAGGYPTQPLWSNATSSCVQSY